MEKHLKPHLTRVDAVYVAILALTDVKPVKQTSMSMPKRSCNCDLFKGLCCILMNIDLVVDHSLNFAFI